MDVLQVVIFAIDKQYYGLPLLSIEQVIRAVQVIPFSKMNHVTLGVINIHGKILPALNFRLLMAHTPREVKASDFFIIVQSNRYCFVLPVDRLIEVANLPHQKIQREKIEFTSGVFKHSHGLIFLLDVPSLIAAGDITNFTTEMVSEHEG